ncbi:hypothetical protein [Vulcanisaeta sp. JCM 16159]|uniref:hypothetical protein n=1 Tax=Vulcanisaeta sp. JCM 16159 TaxID=1295371 RepID=UPI001FB38FEA|nr:hypothetical protein [Vulcanisaeta sp. JCM 16159]
MSSALGQSTVFNTELLRKNHFCMGKRRSKRYVCSSEVDEPNIINNVVELIIEAIRRIWHWRVWDLWWVEEWMDKLLIIYNNVEVWLRGKYGEEVINNILRLVDEFISYNERLWKYWHDVSNEVKRLIEDLVSGRAEVIIRGNDISGISVHGKYITLSVDKASNDSIMVQLKLKGFESVIIEVLDVFMKTMSREEYAKFVNGVLRALRGGFDETDGFNERGKATMGTT